MKKLYLFFQVLPVVVFAFFFASNVSAQIVVTDDNAYNESFEGLGLSNWITEAVEGETVWEASYGESHSGSKSVSFSYGLDMSGLMGGGGFDISDLLSGDISDLSGLLGLMDGGGTGTTGGSSARIISPVLDLSSLGNQTTLKFYRKQVSSTAQLIFTVFYRTSPSGQWIELGRYTNATGGWTQEVLTLPSISSTYQISFLVSVDLSSEIDFMSLLGGLGGLFGGGGGSMDISSTIYLDDVYIGASTGGGSSSSCGTPQNLSVSDLTPTGETVTATITWGGTAESWTIEIGAAGFSQGTGTTANVPSAGCQIQLSPNTTYDMYVRANCADGTSSDWARITFNTSSGTGIAENGTALLTISPNPTTGILRCNFNNELTNARLQVFDVFGKLLIEQPVTENTTVLDLSNRASGVYFLRVISDNKVVTTQKVVRR